MAEKQETKIPEWCENENALTLREELGGCLGLNLYPSIINKGCLYCRYCEFNKYKEQLFVSRGTRQ